MENEKQLDFTSGSIHAVIEVNGKLIEAVLGNPTSVRELEHSEAAFTEVTDLGRGEEKVVNHQEEEDAKLFDELVTEVKGVRLRSEPKGAGIELRPATEELKAAIIPEWKGKFVACLRRGDVDVIEDEEDSLVLGAEVLTVRYSYPSKLDPQLVVDFGVPSPPSSVREDFQNKITSFTPKSRTTRNASGKYVLHLKRAVKLFDGQMKMDDASITGGVVGERTFIEAQASGVLGVMSFLEAIRPIIKLKVISAVVGYYSAKVQD